MLRNIFWTIFCIVFPVVGIGVVFGELDTITEAFQNGDWGGIILGIVMLLFIIAPGWFLWKGTKLVPIISNFIVRIMTMILFLLILPVMGGAFIGTGDLNTAGEWILMKDTVGIVAFSLIGIWLK